MVIPNTLLVALRGFACKATAADSTWLAAPAVSVATTVRITLPASTVTVSMHAGKMHCSCWRKLFLTESAFASYSSTVPTAFSTNVTSLADTVSMVAPGGKDGRGGCGVGGGGGGNTGGHASASREKHGSSSLPGQLPVNFICTPMPRADNAVPHSPNLYLMLQLESTTLDGSRSTKTHVRETASEQSDLAWYAQVIESPEHVSFW